MWWKIVEQHEYGVSYKTLKHANFGSRLLVKDAWLEADVKEVRDGSGGRWYTSGWHVIPTLIEAEQYLTKFKKRTDLILLPVWAHDVKRKAHSRDTVYLARAIYIGDFPDAREQERHNPEADHDSNSASAAMARSGFSW